VDVVSGTGVVGGVPTVVAVVTGGAAVAVVEDGAVVAVVEGGAVVEVVERLAVACLPGAEEPPLQAPARTVATTSQAAALRRERFIPSSIGTIDVPHDSPR
jgi:hypothetical protein